MGFSWRVKVDGSDIAAIVVDAQSRITYGRRSIFDAPAPTTATVTLLTKDAVPSIAYNYPEFGLGQHGAASGFTPTYLDTYEGASSRITIGAPVVIEVGTPSGFSDIYTQDYANGLDLTRFVGKIQAIDYYPETIQLTCTSPIEELTRLDLVPAGWAAETDAARVQRIATATGHAITVQTGTDMNLLATDPDTDSTTDAYALLQQVATDCGGLLWSDRSGATTYRQIGHASTAPVVQLPPGVTLLDPFSMSLELGTITNTVTVTVGERDPNNGNQRPSYTYTDTASVTEYGQRDLSVTTQLAGQGDAATLGHHLLQNATPAWWVPVATVNLDLANEFAQAAIAGLELGDLVELPSLLAGAPTDSYTAELVGYTETISSLAWTVALNLSPTLDAATQMRKAS